MLAPQRPTGRSVPTSSLGSEKLPNWRSLLHEHFDPASSLRFTASQPASKIGVKNPLQLKLALLARLEGKQPRAYAAMVRRSVGTEDPIREGIVQSCLLYELDRLSELRNIKGNNFRDQITKAIIEAAELDPASRRSNHQRGPALARTVKEVMRARLSAVPLDEIRSWLLSGRAPEADSPYTRVFAAITAQRAGSTTAV